MTPKEPGKDRERSQDVAYKLLNMKEVYLVVVNSDLTEGRGYSRVLRVCESKTTAKRLGKGKNVQGSDAEIQEGIALCIEMNGNRLWLVPGEIDPASSEDMQLDAKRRLFESALKKAEEAGLTPAELKLLVEFRE